MPFDPSSDPAKVLTAQANALGVEVDRRWSIETFASKVLEAQQTDADKERADYEAAQKTPVRMLRNGFPLSHVKVSKGEVVDVPIPLAKQWVRTGVAERADPFPGEDA